jgi:hypothetical protein
MNLTITCADQPTRFVRDLGLASDGPYLQDVWLGAVGPSVVALIRRAQQMTRQAGGPAEVTFQDMSRALGLVAGDPTSRNSSFGRTLARADQFGVARLWRATARAHLEVWNQVAPISRRSLQRPPEFVRQEHFRAMEAAAGRLCVDLSSYADLGRPLGRASGRRVTADAASGHDAGIERDCIEPAVPNRHPGAPGTSRPAGTAVPALDRLEQLRQPGPAAPPTASL